MFGFKFVVALLCNFVLYLWRFLTPTGPAEGNYAHGNVALRCTCIKGRGGLGGGYSDVHLYLRMCLHVAAQVGASVPWDVSDPPPLANVPYSDQYPASLYKRDMFHVIKHGVGREATASILLLLSYLTYFDFPGDSRNLPDRLQRGFKMFKLWCEVEAKTSSMKNFTKANLHFAKKSSFPYMGGKGSDTTWVLMWLDFFLHCCLRDMKGDHKTLLTAMLQLCQGTLNYLGIMHSHDLWLPRSCAQFMVKQGLSSFKGILLLC